jgi:hypothetical protein
MPHVLGAHVLGEQLVMVKTITIYFNFPLGGLLVEDFAFLRTGIPRCLFDLSEALNKNASGHWETKCRTQANVS